MKGEGLGVKMSDFRRKEVKMKIIEKWVGGGVGDCTSPERIAEFTFGGKIGGTFKWNVSQYFEDFFTIPDPFCRTLFLFL